MDWQRALAYLALGVVGYYLFHGLIELVRRLIERLPKP